MNNKNLPEENGWYWVIVSPAMSYNAIAKLYGTAPFLKVDVFNLWEEEYIVDINPHQIDLWGEMIELPKLGGFDVLYYGVKLQK